MLGKISPPPRVSVPDMHHDTCVMHGSWCMPVSLSSGFLWSRWWRKCSRHSRCMRNPQFCVSRKRPMPSNFFSYYPRPPGTYLVTPRLSRGLKKDRFASMITRPAIVPALTSSSKIYFVISTVKKKWALWEGLVCTMYHATGLCFHLWLYHYQARRPWNASFYRNISSYDLLATQYRWLSTRLR